MAASNTLNAKGLYTFSNYYSQIPAGAQLVADNVNIDRDGVIEPRRGLKQFAALPASVEPKQLLTYKDTILAHYNSNLCYYNGTNFSNFSSSISEPETGLRIKNIEANGNLYLTSSSGIKKISAVSSGDFSSADLTDAGGIKALNISLKLNAVNLGFLEAGSKVGYRVLWATNDVNDNAVLGSPSSFVEISNYGTNSSNVDVTIQVPDEITTDYYFQIYRTTIVPVAADLTDELKLVYEQAHDGSTSYTITDQYPEDLRVQATSLYTNEFSGEGIIQANIKPPRALDITSYKNTSFIANTVSKSFLLNTFLGTGGIIEYTVSSLTGGSTVTVDVGTTSGLTSGDTIVLLGTDTYNIDGFYSISNVTATTFDITITGTLPAGAMITGGAVVYNSYLSLDTTNFFFAGRRQKMNFTFNSSNAPDYDEQYVTVYSAEDKTIYTIWFSQTSTSIQPAGVPGSTYVKVDISGIPGVAVDEEVRAEFENTISSVVFDLEVVSSVSTPANESDIDTASSGQCTYASSSSAFITVSTTQEGVGVESYASVETSSNKLATRSTFLSAAAQIEETTKDLTRAINESDEPVYGYYISSQEGLPGEFTLESQEFNNTFTISVYPQHLEDNFNIQLPQTSKIEIFPNRLYYSKLYQPEAFTLAGYIDIGPKDKAIKRIIGLRDSLFIFKEEGIYRLSGSDSFTFNVALFDSSATITAPDTAAILNNQIYILTSQGVISVSETGVNIISRPIENILNKTSTVNNYKTMSFGIASESDRSYMIAIPVNEDDTYATKIFRYNTFTSAWTSWTKNYSCGITNFAEAKIYFGSATDFYVEVERKNLNRKDYSDREYTDKTLFARISAKVYLLNTLDNIQNYDAIVQTQYLTIAQYNRFINQLNNDTLFPVNNLSEITVGVSLNTALSTLYTALITNDPLGSYTAPSGSNVFSVLQSEFNSLVTSANNSAGINYNNFMQSVGTTEYEARILDFDNKTKQITLDSDSPFIIGPIVHEKGIESTIVWAPETFGDVIMWKHVREGRIYFENTAFEGGSLGYSSDITGNFEDIDFSKEQISDWGLSSWNDFTWGGDGLQYPFRTLIPRQKQRCRMLKTRFKHSFARDKFAVYGIGYIFETTSERTNK